MLTSLIHYRPPFLPKKKGIYYIWSFISYFFLWGWILSSGEAHSKQMGKWVQRLGVGKICDVCWRTFREDQCSWRYRQGPDHEGQEDSLDMIGPGKKPRILEGSCKHCLVAVKWGPQPSSPSAEAQPGQLGQGLALPWDQGLHHLAVLSLSVQGPGSRPASCSGI